jgi:2-oxoglutarate dehydrogenase E1 component
LDDYRSEYKIKDVKIIRIEQIYPFPFDRLSEILMKYKDCEMIWAQEEPKNMGTWGFVKSRIRHVFVKNNYEKKIHYVGRRPAAAPATGISKRHITNQMLIKELALKSPLKRVIKERSGVSFMKFKNLPKE